jgi:hypothetical protein
MMTISNGLVALSIGLSLWSLWRLRRLNRQNKQLLRSIRWQIVAIDKLKRLSK